jgi:hypothetical protein
MAEIPIYPVRRAHLDELRGPLAIWQHATGRRPNPDHGYDTDDVARALIVDLLHARQIGWPQVEPSAELSLTFLRDAFNPATGRFRNLRSASGRWLEETGSEDSHARAVAALARAMAECPEPGFAREAARLLEQALPGAATLHSVRPMAAALIGFDAALQARDRPALASTFRVLAANLAAEFEGQTAEWPWPDPVVTYENALLPAALIVAGGRLGDHALLELGLEVLDWLARAQTTASGQLSLVGNRGWWPQGGKPAAFDQQPIDATAFILAADRAFAATGDPKHLALAEMAYGWFMGENEAGLALADTTRGGCFDGLCPDGLNLNQGAESTLMWLTALETMRALRALPAAARLVDRAPQPVTGVGR